MDSGPIQLETAISSFYFTFISQLLYAPSIVNNFKHELYFATDYFGLFLAPARRVTCVERTSAPMTCAV
jgi:hypothetical protein